MLLAGGLLKKNIMCIKIFIRYHHLPHLQVKKINYSAIIDFFNNVIQIIYWPGWCRHRWLAALKASPTSPRPLLTFHHWGVKSSFDSLWTCFGAKRMENVNFGTCFQGAVGVSPASNFQRLPWKSSKWHSPQPARLRLNYEYRQNVVDTSPSF